MATRSDSWTLRHCRFAIGFPQSVVVDSLRPGEDLVYISQDDMYVVSGDWFATHYGYDRAQGISDRIYDGQA